MKKQIMFILFFTFNLNVFNNATGQQQEQLRKAHTEMRQMAALKSERVSRMLAAEQQKTDNQDRFDVKHYDLDLFMDVDQEQIIGTVTILAEVIESAVDQVELNLLDNRSYFDKSHNSYHNKNQRI